MHLHLLSGNVPHAVPFAVLFLCALVLRKRGFCCKPRHLRFRFFGAAVGNALQTLHIFVDPGVRYVIAEKLEEHAEEHGEDDPADPVKHFERQLSRIRRGEQLDRLTIRMKE